MNNIFRFVERPYNLRSNQTSERKRDHTIYRDSENPSSLVPKLWDLLPILIKTLHLSRNSKQKLILGQLCPVLAEYVTNMLREQDSFRLFYRFSTFGFVIPLLVHLHIMFLSCASFSDIFFTKPGKFHFIQLFEIFNFMHSYEDILTD